MKRLILFLLGLLLLTSGCYYTFSPNLPEGIETVAVPIIKNTTYRFGIEQELTTAVIEELLTNSPLTVSNEENADALLDITITGYYTRAVSYDADELVKQRELKVTLEVVFRDLAAKKDLWHDSALAERVLYYDENTAGYTAETEEQVFTRLVDLLAERLINRIVEGW